VTFLNPFTLTNVGRDSTVGIATRYSLDGPWTEFQRGDEIFRPILTVPGPTQHPLQRVPYNSQGKFGRGEVLTTDPI
jgi:hypothetical protein